MPMRRGGEPKGRMGMPGSLALPPSASLNLEDAVFRSRQADAGKRPVTWGLGGGPVCRVQSSALRDLILLRASAKRGEIAGIRVSRRLGSPNVCGNGGSADVVGDGTSVSDDLRRSVEGTKRTGFASVENGHGLSRPASGHKAHPRHLHSTRRTPVSLGS